MTHADRDGSERELSAYLAADKAEPAPDADRESRYAEAVDDASPRARVRAVLALADREIAEATEHCKPAEDAWRELVADKDARIAELERANRDYSVFAEARIAELEAEVDAMPYCSRVYYQREAARADAAEAKVARVEALAETLWGDPNQPHDGHNVVQLIHRHIVAQIRDALAGDA